MNPTVNRLSAVGLARRAAYQDPGVFSVQRLADATADFGVVDGAEFRMPGFSRRGGGVDGPSLEQLLAAQLSSQVLVVFLGGFAMRELTVEGP